MSTTKPVEFVNVHGMPVNVAASSAKPKARPRSEPSANYHKGWSVVGYGPFVVANAEALAFEELSRWFAMSSTEQADWIKRGNRQPAGWDEARWRGKNRPKSVRSKPFSTASAADDCADVARKSGWTHVEVLELKKGTLPVAPEGGFFA